MPRNVDGEIIVGIDIPASTKIVESDIQILLNKLTTLEAKINHAELTPVAKRELQNEINNLKNLTAYISDIELDDTAKKNLRSAIGKVNNLTANIQNAKLDPNFQTNLQSALSGLGGLAINISNVNINQNAVQGAGQKIGQQIGQQVQQGLKSIIQKNDFQLEFGFDGLNPRNQTAQRAKEYFQGISDGIVTVREEMRNLEGNTDLQGFVVDIKNAEGVVESLRYAITNLTDDNGNILGQIFEYRGGSINDKGVIKQFTAIENAIASYEQKVAQFKSTNEGILSGIDFTKFDNALTALKNGTGSIDAVKNAYKDLGVQASTITQELSGQLSKAGTAVRNVAKGSETISKLRTEFSNLKDAPKGVMQQLDALDTKLAELHTLESTTGRDSNWAKLYREYQDEVDVLTAKLRASQTEQHSAESKINSILDKQLQAYKKIYDINKQIAKETDSGVIASLRQQQANHASYWADSQNEINQFATTNPELYAKAIEARNIAQQQIANNTRAEISTIQQRNRAEVESRKIVEDRTKYHTKLNTAKKEELALAKQLITADGKQREVVRNDYNKRVSRVKYNKNELTKRNLWRGSQEFDFNSLSIDGANEVNRLMAKEIDKLISSLDKLEKEYRESGASVDVFEAQMQSAKKTLSEITLNTKDVGKNLSSIGKVRDILSGVSSGRSNVDSVLTKRTDAYKQILTLNGQIARLDKVKDSEHIAKLQEERRIQQDIYDSATQELNVLSRSLQTMEERNRLAKLSSEYTAKAYNNVARDFRYKDQQQANKDAESYAKKREQNESRINAELGKQKSALNEIILLENKIKNLDPSKESEQIANLKNQKKEQQAIYDASKERMSILAKEIYSEQEVAELKERQTREMREQNAISRQSVSAINEKAFNKAEDDKKSQRIKEANDLYSKQTQKLNEILSLEKKIETNELKGNVNKLEPELSRKAVLEEEYKSLSKQLDKYSDVIDRQKQCSLHEEQRRRNESEVLEILGRELDTLEKVEAKEQERLANKAKSDHDAKQAMYEKLWFDYDNGNLDKVKTIDDKVANNTYATQINDLITKYKQYGLTVDQAEDKVRELRSTLATMSNADKFAEERIKAEERYQQALKKSQNEVKVFSQNQRGLATDQQRLALANSMEAFLQKNTRITAKARQETEMYIATLRNLNSEMTTVAKNDINNSFKQMQNNMRVLGKLGYALKDQMKQATGSFVQWFSVSNLIMTGIYHIRQIPTAVKEVNSAMIELNKVSSASSQEIANYFKDASYHAKDLGASISDVISATADWSRLGYNLPDSEELARVALIYKNVGDGIDIDTATESLTSTLQGFQLEASEAIGVVDKFNEVKFVASFHSNMVACILYT